MTLIVVVAALAGFALGVTVSAVIIAVTSRMIRAALTTPTVPAETVYASSLPRIDTPAKV